MKYIFPALLILLAPNLALAQSSLQNALSGALTFIDGVLIPFLFGVAFLFFIVNIVRYLVLDGGNEDARDNAKNLALYGFGAFVFLIIFWGIVNLVVDSLGLNCGAIRPDYLGQSTSAPCRSSGLINKAPATTFNPPATDNTDNINGLDLPLDSASNNADDLDLSVDNITNDTSSTDSPAGCISFSIDGLCLDSAPSDSQNDLLTDSFRGAIISYHANDETWDIGPITNTPNSSSYEITNVNRGATFLITQTNINTDSGNDDMMLRIEEVRRPDDTSTAPLGWSTASFTYNETTNQMDVFIVSNTTLYSRTYNGVAYVNTQGQMVMQLRDSNGRDVTWSQSTWLTDFIEGRPVPTGIVIPQG
jgi:succinate dehydrogenase/fumarate reductase cytochrome b subunit